MRLKDGSIRAPKRTSRSGGKGRSGRAWQIHVHPGPLPGPDIRVPSPAEVMAALERVDPLMPWAEARGLVIPMFDRVRPYPLGSPEPVRTLIPPGVSVSFGVDVGPAHLKIGPELLSRWGISIADLSSEALVNVARIADGLDLATVRMTPAGGVPVAALQTGAGMASTLVLLPDAIRRLFGNTPRTFIAPCRDVLLGLPSDVDRDLVLDLYLALAEQDPDCLHPVLFHLDGGAMSFESLGLALFASHM